MNKPIKTAAKRRRRPQGAAQNHPGHGRNVAVGGGAPIVVQSMTNTDTADVAGTVEQIAALARAGSELVRIRSIATRPQLRCRTSATVCASAASPHP